MSSLIFLSASVPLPNRDVKYFETADVIAIRDSVRALVTATVPFGKIIFGGHPAITPMIRMMLRNMGVSPRMHITLYQSRYFQKDFPADNDAFESLVLVDAADSRDTSLLNMRKAMISSHDFAAAIFIGGMEGVEQEYKLFREIHSQKPAYPIASTGAAAKFLFDRNCPEKHDLLADLHYLSLFRRLLEIRKS